MKRHAVLTSTFTNEFDTSGTLQARALKGAHSEPLRRRARWVAAVIGIALSIVPSPISQGSIKPYQNIRSIADYQLTEVQEKCHNEIIYRESRYDINAINGSHYGYYQIKNELMIGKPFDYQFYFYWHYVLHRYGITEYDEPDYCKALHHLKVRGWQ